jgi:hypothetical protein
MPVYIPEARLIFKRQHLERDQVLRASRSIAAGI